MSVVPAMVLRFYDEAAEGGTAVAEPEADTGSSLRVEGESSQSESVESSGSERPEPVAQEPEDKYAAIFDYAREHGLDLSPKYRDGKTAVEGLLNAYRAVGKKDSYAELGRRYAQYADDFEEYIRSKRTPQQQGRQAEPGDAWDLPRPLGPEVQQYLVRDERGVVTISEDAPAEARAAFERFEHQRRAWAQTLTTDPESIFSKLEQRFEQKFLDKFNGLLSQREQQVQAQATAQQLFSEVAPWLYQTGADGKPLSTYDAEGRVVPVFTPKGAEYVQALRELAASGMADTKAMHAIALRLVGGPPTAETAAPAQRPGATKTPKRSPKPYENTQEMSLADIAMANGDPLGD